MNLTANALITLALFFIPSKTLASDGHDHSLQHQEKYEELRDHIGTDHKNDQKDHHDNHQADEHGNHHDEEESKIFKLSDKAASVINLKTASISKSKKDSFNIPTTAVLFYSNKKAVYRKKDHHYELIEILITSKTNYKNKTQIKSSKLKDGDEIVINGVPLLRISHIQLTGQGGSHSH